MKILKESVKPKQYDYDTCAKEIYDTSTEEAVLEAANVKAETRLFIQEKITPQDMIKYCGEPRTDIRHIGPAYITADGKFYYPLDLPRGVARETHCDLVEFVCAEYVREKYTPMFGECVNDLAEDVAGDISSYLIDDFTKQLGYVRINTGASEVDGRFYTVVFNRLSGAQATAFEKFIRLGMSRASRSRLLVFVLPNATDEVSAWLSLIENSPEDIIRKINEVFRYGDFVENLNKKKSAKRLAESNHSTDKYTFDAIWDRVFTPELNELNRFLDKWGFEVQIVDDYYDLDSDVYENGIGMFCSDIQDCASIFPVFINKEKIYELLKEDGFENDFNEIRDAIRGTLWHEAGHGIINYLYYEFDFDDEEEAAEEFARYPEDCDVTRAMEEYIEETE